MTLPEFLTQDADGYIHLARHRVGLKDLVYFYNEGYSPEALLETFPTLSLAVIHKVIAFYLEGKAEVDAYMAADEAEIERQREMTQLGPSTAELRGRLARKQASGT